MPLLLIRLLPVIGGAVLSGILAFWLHGVDVARREALHKKALTELSQKMTEQCENDKRITAGVANGLRRKISNLNTAVAALRMRPSTCVPVLTPKPTAGDDGTTFGNELPRPHGVTSGALIDIAADAEASRLRLLACQDFINKTWESR